MLMDLVVCALATLAFYASPFAALGVLAGVMAIGDRLWLSRSALKRNGAR